MSRTIAYVKEKLELLGVETRFSEDLGLVGIIRGQKSSPCILLRADMDALPITEETGLEFSSRREGRMHACGHDLHTAWLLGAAELLMLNKNTLEGTVKLAFQPCEEGKGSPGAKEMIAEGILEDPKVDAAVAVHVTPDIPVEKYSISSGGVTTTPCIFEIGIEGKGGHAAEPWKCTDPILVMNRIYTEIQSIQRSLLSPKDKAVISITSVHGGNAFNVIPDRVSMGGTIRTYSRKTAELLTEKIEEIVRYCGEADKAKTEFHYEIPIGSCVNDAHVTGLVKSAVRSCLGEAAIYSEEILFMGGDDFSCFSEAVPSCYFFAGVKKEGRGNAFPLHNCRFDPDESCLCKTAAVLARLALDFTAEKRGE